MTKALAYCEQAGRNITLDEAKARFFAQPEDDRDRFIFRCGDPKCRTTLNPLIVAALYDREDAPGKKLRSPYYREHQNHPHIEDCTWISDKDEDDPEREKNPDPEPTLTSAVAELGLVFRPNATKVKQSTSTGKPDPDSDAALGPDPAVDADKGQHPGEGIRPETSKFLAVVGSRYLAYTDTQRKSIELSIENISKGTFYSLCIPITGFHPFYQKGSIYHGPIRVTELTHVHMVRFLWKMNPDGDRNDRTITAEIKILKKWLEENDRALGAWLHDVATSEKVAWCFFYTEESPTKKGKVAQFTVANAAHIAVIEQHEQHSAPGNGE